MNTGRGPRLEVVDQVILLGVILLVLGFFLHIGLLWTLGIIAVVIGGILWIAGAVGHPVAGRRHYW